LAFQHKPHKLGTVDIFSLWFSVFVFKFLFPVVGDAEGGRPGSTGTINMYNVGASASQYNMSSLAGTHQDLPTTTSAIIYQVQLGGYSGAPAVFLNRSGAFQLSANNYDAVPVSTITLMEIAV
jgi:hypothetical protein